MCGGSAPKLADIGTAKSQPIDSRSGGAQGAALGMRNLVFISRISAIRGKAFPSVSWPLRCMSSFCITEIREDQRRSRRLQVASPALIPIGVAKAVAA
jgi:hypothetical protein